jgi:hypothetical protein
MVTIRKQHQKFNYRLLVIHPNFVQDFTHKLKIKGYLPKNRSTAVDIYQLREYKLAQNKKAQKKKSSVIMNTTNDVTIMQRLSIFVRKDMVVQRHTGM